MSPAHQNIRGQSDRLVEEPPDGGFPADLLRQNRRRALGLLGAITLTPLLRASSAHAAVAHAYLSFRALRKGSPIGVHTVTFRQDGERLVVTTHQSKCCSLLPSISNTTRRRS